MDSGFVVVDSRFPQVNFAGLDESCVFIKYPDWKVYKMRKGDRSLTENMRI